MITDNHQTLTMKLQYLTDQTDFGQTYVCTLSMGKAMIGFIIVNKQMFDQVLIFN